MATTSTISSLGIGSGLDANSIVTKLVALESQPITALQTAASKIQTKISAYGQVQSAVSAVRDAARKLTSADLWGSTTATSADATSVNATTLAGAQAGTYSVDVRVLAKPQSVVSNTALKPSDTPLGSGSFEIEVGTWTNTSFTAKDASTPIKVTVAATDTLADIRDKINSSGSGVKASIITDASGARLVMQSSTTGEASGFRVTAQDDDGDSLDGNGLSALAYDPGAGTTGSTLTQAATDAVATINNIEVKSATNTLSEVVSGLTLNLSKVTTTATGPNPVNIVVGQDNATITKAITDFAAAYSSMASLLKADTKYDESSKTAGPLQGDSGVLSVQNQFRSIMGGSSNASSTFNTLSAIGLEMQTDGTVKVNTTKLTSSLANLGEVKKLFSNSDSADSAKDGVMTRLRALGDQLLGTDGALTTRTAGMNKSIKDNQTRQDALQARVDLYEKRLRAQYSALDTTMAGLSSQGNYVTQMINSLNKSSS
ncbi:MAG: flagellar hook protein [Rubrivivax sp.]|nr:MAG: flagellar hook protein [Rubrivivax sp.]